VVTTKLLDTNICIEVLRGRSAMVSRFSSEFAEGGDLRISTITVFELVYGAARSGREGGEVAKIARFIEGGPAPVNLDQTDAESAGRVRADLTSRGLIIGAYDLLIAGQALARGWTVVSANIREFERVQGLNVESWG
jgi:tRNA(fMet)-specific endonuclease VapC